MIMFKLKLSTECFIQINGNIKVEYNGDELNLPIEELCEMYRLDDHGDWVAWIDGLTYIESIEKVGFNET